MTRSLGTIHAATAGMLLIAAACAAPAQAGEAGDASGTGPAGPVMLFQQVQQASIEEYAPAVRTEARARQPQAAAPLAREVDQPLDRRAAVVQRTQASLTRLGFDPGPVDGKMGPQTRRAIRAFQLERQQRADGEVSYALLREISAALAEARGAGGGAGSHSGGSETATAPGELRSERNTVELVGAAEAPEATELTEATEATGSRAEAERGAKPAVRLIASAEAAAPAAPDPAPAAAAASLEPVDDGAYDLGDAIADSWTIVTSVSGALVAQVEARLADAVR